MLENDIELGESLFSHRKSKVHLLTKAVATVSCKDAHGHASDPLLSDQAFQPCRSWLPRARSFLFSLQLYFAHDVALTSVVSQEIDSIVADLIESAEVSLTAS
jgi:hypothetical protein